MQTALVLIVVALCLGYAAWRAYCALHHAAADPCQGCEDCALRSSCEKKRGVRSEARRVS